MEELDGLTDLLQTTRIGRGLTPAPTTLSIRPSIETPQNAIGGSQLKQPLSVDDLFSPHSTSSARHVRTI